MIFRKRKEEKEEKGFLYLIPPGTMRWQVLCIAR